MKNWWESWFIIEDTTLIFPNITSGLVANQYIFINNRLCLSTEVVGDTMHDNPLLADHLLRDNTFWNRHDLRFTYPVNWKCLLHSLAESIGTDSVLASAIVLYRKERNSPFCKRQPTQFFASFVDHTGCQRAHRRCGKLFWWHFLFFAYSDTERFLSKSRPRRKDSSNAPGHLPFNDLAASVALNRIKRVFVGTVALFCSFYVWYVI